MKECKHHNCRTLIKRGAYCDRHKTKHKVNITMNKEKNDDAMKFYRSKEWRETRQEVLKRDCFTCAMCGGTANLVHQQGGSKDGLEQEARDEQTLSRCVATAITR